MGQSIRRRCADDLPLILAPALRYDQSAFDGCRGGPHAQGSADADDLMAAFIGFIGTRRSRRRCARAKSHAHAAADDYRDIDGDELHDELQLDGGELPDHLRASERHHRHGGEQQHPEQRVGGNIVPTRLLDEPDRLPDLVRATLALAVILAQLRSAIA